MTEGASRGEGGEMRERERWGSWMCGLGYC